MRDPSTLAVPIEQAALFLDLDGTLAPIVATPEEVVPEARRTAILARAQAALDGRLAVISGRTVEEVRSMLGRKVQGIFKTRGLSGTFFLVASADWACAGETT